MKRYLIYFLILVSFPLNGQIYHNDDTIRINEVLITGNKNNSEPPGYKKSTIDSVVMENNSQSSLSEMLSEKTNIFIKSYGMGGIATPSFRGTGASHTLIDWNGININSPMLGQTDLSLIPAGLVDDIQIYYGGASMSLGSGGIGGIINLGTRPVWKKETSFSLGSSYGSFGRYSGLLKFKSGNTNFQTVTKLFFQSADNDFRYLNNALTAIPVWETRTNSQLNQKGLLQEIYYRNTNSFASVKIWYQSANRNLPATMLTRQPNSSEKQFDESFRSLLNYNFLYGKSDFFLTGALLFSRLNYSNKLVSIDSRNSSETSVLKAGFKRPLADNMELKVFLNEELNVIKSNNYLKNTSRNTLALTASADNRNDGRIGTHILVREILDRNRFLIPDFSAAIQFRIFDEKEYFLKGNISRNSKIPTMNEMFWLPGGNPDLKNEYAFIYELIYEMDQPISAPLKMKYDLSVFSNNIKDMILWHPGEYSYWTADNIQNVKSAGLESSFTVDYFLNNITSSLSAGYSFTKTISASSATSDELSSDKQLIYIPRNQANASFRLCIKNIYSIWTANYTGKRFITADNSRFLPDYLLNNLCTGIKLHRKGALIDINLNIENLFDINYQSIAYYPLPGRYFLAKIIFQLSK